MKRRLRRNEREEVRHICQDNLLYKAISTPCKHWEAEQKQFKMSAEEVFLECMSKIDDIKEMPSIKKKKACLDGWWEELYCELRDLDVDDTEEAELKQSVSEVVYAVVVLLSMLDDPRYGQLSMLLLNQLCVCHNVADSMQTAFMPHIWKLDEEEVRLAMNSYMESDNYISNEIWDALNALDKEEAPTGRISEERDHSVKILTKKQLQILFVELLNIDLPESNKKAIAQLISKVSGYSVKSMANTLGEEFDYSKSRTREDVELIASLLEPIKPDIAARLRNDLNI